MSALDDAYKAAGDRAAEVGRSDGNIAIAWYTVGADEVAREAVDAFLAHLTDNPPDEMVWAATEALVQPHYLRRSDVRLALSAALRSITEVKTDA